MAYAHGKVILLGEHAVVYGRPALAKAIDRAATVTAHPSSERFTTLHVEPWKLQVSTCPEVNAQARALQEALQVARAFYDDALELTLQAKLSIPAGAGMGSSAALGVAVLRALDEARNLSRSNAEVFERSFAWERVFHDTPGGVDNAMATFGGLAIYRRGHPLQPLHPSTNAPLRLVAVDCGLRLSTKEMVGRVRRQYESDPERVSRTFDAIAAVVEQGKSALESGDWQHLGQLMTLNQELLAELQLSTAALDRAISVAREAGALGAKLTGAGGGGCVLALAPDLATQEAVAAALRPLGRVYEV